MLYNKILQNLNTSHALQRSTQEQLHLLWRSYRGQLPPSRWILIEIDKPLKQPGDQ